MHTHIASSSTTLTASEPEQLVLEYMSALPQIISGEIAVAESDSSKPKPIRKKRYDK